MTRLPPFRVGDPAAFGASDSGPRPWESGFLPAGRGPKGAKLLKNKGSLPLTWPPGGRYTPPAIEPGPPGPFFFDEPELVT
jgi:hypothetical protein